MYVSIFVRLIVAGLLIWALARHPYGYYTLLRWIVCASVGYLLYVAYDLRKTPWVWIFGAIAVLFNPIIPIYLTKSTWAPIDAISAGIVVISIFFIREKVKSA
jgi:ABC-type Fe3+-siderophore transport system permease subunit